jgi:lysophospholipase L1-like esterase
VRGHDNPKQFEGGFDSGDHLHPSAKAYEAMAECVPEELLK